MALERSGLAPEKVFPNYGLTIAASLALFLRSVRRGDCSAREPVEAEEATALSDP